MVLHLTAEQEAHLSRIAQHEGKNPEQLVIDTVFNLMEEDARVAKVICERLEEADRGEFIEKAEMDAAFERCCAALGDPVAFQSCG